MTAPATSGRESTGMLTIYHARESGLVKVGKYTRIRFIKASPKGEPEADDGWIDVSAADDWGDVWGKLRREYQTGEAEARLEADFHQSIRYTLNEATYSTYLAGTVILSCRDQTVVMGTSNPYSRDFIEGRLLDKLQTWFSNQMGEPVTLVVEVLDLSLQVGKE